MHGPSPRSQHDTPALIHSGCWTSFRTPTALSIVSFARLSEALTARSVPAVFAQRRDNFLSAELRWLVACLTQISRPLDKRNLAVLVEAFNRMTGTETAVGQIVADAETSGRGYLATWMDTVSPLDY